MYSFQTKALNTFDIYADDVDNDLTLFFNSLREKLDLLFSPEEIFGWEQKLRDDLGHRGKILKGALKTLPLKSVDVDQFLEENPEHLEDPAAELKQEWLREAPGLTGAKFYAVPVFNEEQRRLVEATAKGIHEGYNGWKIIFPVE